MCGITFFLSKTNDNIISLIMQSITFLQNRGYDSTGLGYFSNNKFNIIKQIQTPNLDSIDYIYNVIKKNNIVSNCALAHTRWATHGGISIENTHPHTSSDNNIILVHNGIIENYLELKNFLLKKNIVFNSETDSEVICKLIEYYNTIEYNTEKSIKLTCKQLQGTWGLIIIDIKNNITYLTKNGSPLLVGFNEKLIIACSENIGFNNYIKKYIKLENNNLYKIENYIFSKINNNIDNINDVDIKYSYLNLNNDININNFKYWTIKEIYEQPNSILNAINNGGRITNNIIKLGGLELIKNKINFIDNIILLGCGTSYNACLIAKNYFKQYNIFNTIQVYDGAEFTSNDIPNKGNTIVFFSTQSGETQDLYKNIEICRKKNTICIGVVNIVDSIIASEVDCGVYLNAGREIAVASTKSFTSMLIIYSLISMYFYQNSNKYLINNNNINNNISNIYLLPDQINNILKNNINQIEIFKDIILNKFKISSNNTMFILGRGNMYPIAREAALKIKEISYIHAEAYHGGALKHGPLALIDNNVCIFFIIDKENKIDMLNCYQEVKARNGYCFIVTELSELIELSGENTEILIIEQNNYQEILFIIIFQYLAYQLSISKGINPDKPKNLAKVVTVQ